MADLLLNRIIPLENESLGGIITRLGKINHYEKNWYEKCAVADGVKKWRKNPSVSYRMKELIDLAQLTGLDFIELYNASIHNLARNLFPDTAFEYENDVPFLKESFVRKHINYSNAKYCPFCIAQGSGYLIQWHYSLVTSCPKHSVLLMDCCPECGGAVSEEEVVSGYHSCNAHLSNSRPTSIEENNDAKKAGLFIGYLLGTVDKSSISKLPDPILSLSPPLLYTLIYAFAQAVRMLKKPSVLLATDMLGCDQEGLMNMPRQHILVSAAFKMMLDWPKNFIMFLREYRIQQGPRYTLGLNQEFKSLRRLLQSLEIEFVQQAFSDFLLDEWDGLLDSRVKEFRQHTNMVNDKKYLSIEDAATMLKLGRRPLTLLVENNILRNKKISSQKHYYYLLERKSVEELAKKRDEYFTLKEAADRLGIIPLEVTELIKAGFLEQSELIKGSSLVFINKLELHSLESRFLCGLEAIESEPGGPNQYVSIHEAASILQFYHFPVAKILGLIEEGTFMTFVFSESKGLSCLRLRLTEVQEYYDLLSKETADDGDPLGEPLELRTRSKEVLLSCYRTARLLGVSTLVIDSWDEAGILTFTKRQNRSGNLVKCLRVADYLRFRREYLFTEQAAEYLKITPSTLLRWLHLGRVSSCNGAINKRGKRYLFKKTELERFTPDNRLTAEEVAAELEVSAGSVHRLVVDKRLIPISGSGIDEFKQHLFLRSDIEKYKVNKERLITLPLAAQILGINEYKARKLILEKLIIPKCGPTVDGNLINLFYKEQIEELNDHISGKEAAAILGYAEITVRKWTKEGRLKAINGPGIDGSKYYKYQRLEIISFQNELTFFMKNKGTKGQYKLLGINEVANALGLSKNQVYKLVKDDILKPYRGPEIDGFASYQFKPRDVLSAKRYLKGLVTAKEAASLLGEDLAWFYQKWVKTGRLEIACSQDESDNYLFRKKDIETLHQRDVLTTSEAAKTFGVTRGTILKWTKQGKLKPVSGPSIDGFGNNLYSRKSLKPLLVT